ncbi:hypothetical protein Aperf_G00000001079 [Anoplocephala perfoliata]
MMLTVKRTCAINHFGDDCCSVPGDRGYCDSDGNPSCYPSYFGPGCTLVDSCRNSTCASFATCEQIGESFTCHCDNTSGERCEEGYDPCREHTCEHGGVCVPTGENKNFAKCVNCSSGWEGLHCEKRLFICELETLKLGHPPCVNGGHCIVSPTNDSTFTCLCASGWQGDRCEVSSLKASVIVAVISMCILILIVCCIIAAVWCCRVYALPKVKGVELRPIKSKSIGELSRANNIYEIARDQLKSQDTSYTATVKQNGTPVKAIPQRSPVNDDEYEIMFAQGKFRSPSPAPELAKEEEDYEPVSYKLKYSLLSEAKSISNNEYYLGNNGKDLETLKRHLPPLPPEGDGYEYLCNCNPEKDHVC